jgi:N-sulfoglucosamine sulfohydrolase
LSETRRLYAVNQLVPVQSSLLEVPRPIEELYDLQEDPYEINNLAASPAHQDILLELRKAHLKWRRDTRDLGVLPEGILLDERGTYGSEYQLGIQEADRIEHLWILLGSLHLKTEAELVDMLNDRDPVVRYWSAIGLGNLLEASTAVKIALESALSDPSTHVRIAAARGLLLKEKNSEALKILRQAIISKGAAGLAASLVVDEAGYNAKELAPELETALEGVYSGEVESRIPQVLRRALETINEQPGYGLLINDSKE